MGLFSNIGAKLASGTAGSLVDSLSNAVGKFIRTPEEKDEMAKWASQAKLDVQKELDDHTQTMEQLYQQELDTVNKTMQAESTSGHWAQWMWRPMVGFTFCAILINNYILVGYFSWAKAVSIPGEVWSAILVILGASAAGRSWEKVTKMQKNQTQSDPSNDAKG